jgi:hypothetical protein
MRVPQVEIDDIEVVTTVDGYCGDVGDIGGALPSQSATGCNRDAECQVFENTSPPEATMIVTACEEHIEKAAEYVEANQ